MRISEIFIDGFGHFRDERIGPFSSPVVVLYGPNEAGKTTLLEFIRTTLFGFPNRNRDRHYPPLAGGRHGGRITVIDDSEAKYVIERHAGSKGGPVEVRDGSGQVMGESVLSSLLGHASDDVFKNVFAFSLEELQSGQLLRDSNVNGQIYSAGLGATKLPDAFKALATRRAKIYLHSGSRQIVAALVSELQAVDSQLALIRGNATEYATLVSGRDTVDHELERTRKEISALVSRRGELTRLEEAWDDWVELVDSEAKLESIPTFNGFPEDAAKRLEGTEERIRSAKEELDDATEQLQRAESAASVPIENEEMLDDSEAIGRINRGRDSFDGSIRDLPERAAELVSLEESIAQRLRNLGSGWDEARLESFDMSIAVRDQIEHWRGSISDKKQRLQQAKDRLQQQEHVLADCKETESEARKKLKSSEKPSLSQDQINDRRSALRASRTRLDEYERKKDSHTQARYRLDSIEGQQSQHQGRQAPGSLLLPIILALLGAALFVAGAFLGQQALIVGAVAAAVLVGLAVYFFARRNEGDAASVDLAGPLRDQVNKASQEESQAEELLLEAAAVLELGLPDASTLDDVEAQLLSMDRTHSSWSALNDNLDEATKTLRRQERRVKDATEAVNGADSELGQEEKEWRKWLEERDLPETFTPETMVDFLSQVESALIELNQVKDRRHRVDAIEVDIGEYREQVEPLAKKYSISISSSDPAHLAAAADSLIDRFDQAREEVTRREQAGEQAHEAMQQHERRETRLHDAKN